MSTAVEETSVAGPYEAKLPRTGYRPAVDYLTEALRGQGKAIATHVDTHLTNEKVLDLAGAINRAVAIALRKQLEEVAAGVLALQFELPECATPERSCRVCGCTYENGCSGGCWWVAQDLCSQCEASDA